jgi:hypothetical protein
MVDTVVVRPERRERLAGTLRAEFGNQWPEARPVSPLRRERARVCGPLAALLVGSTSCVGTDGVSEWITHEEVVEGTRTIAHTPPADARADWTLVPTLRIGTVDGSGPASFASLRGLVVLDDGRIAVLDHTDQEVRVFGPDGRYLVTHGRKGEGPGEFESAYGLMRDSEGRLWVPDHRNARLSVLDPDLGFEWSVPMPVTSYRFVWAGKMLRDDHVWHPTITLGPPRANIIRVFGRAGSPMDSLPLPPDPEIDPEDPPGAFRWRAPDGRSGGYRSVPFYPQGDMAFDPNGSVWSLAYGDPTYRLARWTPGGDTTLVFETRRAPVEVGEEARDSAMAVVLEELAALGVQDLDLRKVPTVRPAVSRLFVADEGDLWVGTPTAEGELFDVYGRDGRHLRTVQNPLSIYPWVPPVVRGDQLWAVATDEFDVQYVVRASLVRAR